MSSDLILAYLIMNLLPGLVFLYFGNKVSRTGKFFHRWFGIGLCLCGIIFAGGPLTASFAELSMSFMIVSSVIAYLRALVDQDDKYGFFGAIIHYWFYWIPPLVMWLYWAALKGA